MLTNEELADAIHAARHAMRSTSPLDLTTMNTIGRHLEALQEIQRKRALPPPAVVVDQSDGKPVDDGWFELIGYITREGLERLTIGGNDSRGTVPIHHSLTRVATTEVFVRSNTRP